MSLQPASPQPTSKPTSRVPRDLAVRAVQDRASEAPRHPSADTPRIASPGDSDLQAPQDRARRAQAEAIRRVRGRPVEPRSGAAGYAGLVTRMIAFAVDGALIWAVAATVGVTVGLGVSLLHLPSRADAAIAAVLAALALLWPAAYFVFFWSSAGQTPGARVMSIAVLDSGGRGGLKPRRALLRFVGLCIAAIPLGAGILIMLFDSRRRCLQDRLARTVVVYVAGGGQRL